MDWSSKLSQHCPSFCFSQAIPILNKNYATFLPILHIDIEKEHSTAAINIPTTFNHLTVQTENWKIASESPDGLHVWSSLTLTHYIWFVSSLVIYSLFIIPSWVWLIHCTLNPKIFIMSIGHTYNMAGSRSSSLTCVVETRSCVLFLTWKSHLNRRTRLPIYLFHKLKNDLWSARGDQKLILLIQHRESISKCMK